MDYLSKTEKELLQEIKKDREEGLKSLTFFGSLHIKLTFYKYRFVDSPAPLLFRTNSYILRIGMTCTIHISTLTGNYISGSINFHSSRIPGINAFQIIDYNCYLVILQYIFVFCRFKKVHSAYIKVVTIKIKTNRYHIWLYGSSFF